MIQTSSVKELQSALQEVRNAGGTIGFVPTMGALHQGHLALVKQSKKECDLTVCSIFVNPLQFNNSTDLELYPRNLEADLKVLNETNCDVVFHPTFDEMYPENKLPEVPELGYLENILEGAFRPGHFKGVAQVVRRFFEIVQPQKAYFGKKDYQQYLVIKHLVSSLQLPIEIIGCETIRSENGLGMSSRNERLNEAQKETALILSRALYQAREWYPNKNPDEIKAHVKGLFEKLPDGRLEYFEIVDADTLKPIRNLTSHPRVIGCVAAYIGDVRLIDNLILFP